MTAFDKAAASSAFGRAQELLHERRLDDAINALNECVEHNPSFALGWLYLGNVLLTAGDDSGHEKLYVAFALNPQLEYAPGSIQAPVAIRQTAASGLKSIRDKFVSVQRGAIDELRAMYDSELLSRIDSCLRIQHGQDKPVYADELQKPDSLFFPGLAARPWFERSEFDWVPMVEAAYSSIRAELDAVCEAQGFGAYTPYVTAGPRVPESMQNLAGSLDWQAFHLYASGSKRDDNCERCPITCDTVEQLPMPVCHGSAPEVFFSFLKPHTHIRPHHGVANTKLAVHLPLVVPAECAIRVGKETRGWSEGRCLIFDDSYEHEAWNNSDQLRVVLIFEVWHPGLSEIERSALTRIFAAVDHWVDTFRPKYRGAFGVIDLMDQGNA